MTNDNFCHLHLHDHYSKLDGFGSPEDYVVLAKAMDFKFIAVTNHGNIDSVVELQLACEKHGLIPIIGCELYIVNDLKEHNKTEQTKHINVWVKNETGWKNLLKMLTIANLDGFYRKPRIDPRTLLNHLDGLVIGTACLGSFITESWGKKLFKQLARKNKDDLYLEIMPHEWTGQAEFNLECLELSKKYDVKLIATNDCHYPTVKDAVNQELLLAIGSRKKWDDPKRWKFESQKLYFCSANKMLGNFKRYHKDIPKNIAKRAVKNTLEVAMKCSGFKIEQVEVKLPTIEQCKGKDENEFFIKLIKRGLRQKIKDGYIQKEDRARYMARVEEELELLIPKGFARYFLIVWELVNWCDENDILVGPGRGSCAGSICAYLIGIVDVDALEYGLIFSRFINPNRNDLPDIDLDFEHDKRQDVIAHIAEMYGRNNVAQIQTFMTIKGKSAIKDVARVYDLDPHYVNKVTKLLDGDEELFLETFLESEEELLRTFGKEHEDIIDKAIDLQGTIRNTGSHAAGVCISNLDLTQGKNCNLVRKSVNGNVSLLANWSKEHCEYMGLMKLDVLAIYALDRLHECLRLVKQNHDVDIVLTKIDLNDKDVMADLDRGDTEGVFQLNTPVATRFCKELGISEFKDIYDTTALIRPGTLRSGMSNEFIKRKHGEPWQAIHENVKELTKDTYGIILYQEQVMRLARELAGMSWADCDKIRKVIAKSKGKAEFNKFRSLFINGCVREKTLDKDTATTLFNHLVEFGGYSFNLSHSVSYSVLTTYDSWFKHYYPLEFYCSSLCYGSEKANIFLLEKISQRGYKIQLPKIGISHWNKWVIHNDCLMMPFGDIKGVGEKMAETIYLDGKKKRGGFFKSTSTSNLPSNTKKMLKSIFAYDKEKDINYNEHKKIRDLFPYDLEFILNL